MLVLSNSVPQTVNAGESVKYDTDVVGTGHSTCHRGNSGTVTIREKGLYEVMFRANISGEPATVPTLAIFYGGDSLPETVMQNSITVATDEYGISAFTVVKNCCGCAEKLSVRNIGTAEVEIINPCFVIKHL